MHKILTQSNIAPLDYMARKGINSSPCFSADVAFKSSEQWPNEGSNSEK